MNGNGFIKYMSRMYQSGHKVTEMIKFCPLMPNIFGSEVWNLLHVT